MSTTLPLLQTEGKSRQLHLPPACKYHNFYITLTHKCNLRCIYCGEEGLHCDVQKEFACDIDVLAKFLSQYQPYYITLYGGEPCLRPKLMERILDRLDPALVILHTNGTLVRHVPLALLARIHTIILSIDGGPVTTDFYRGNGTYRCIEDNVRWLLGQGWDHRIFARMTVSEQTRNLDEAVMHLLSRVWCKFDGVCWQLNALFKSPGYAWSDFAKWLAECYEPAINRLTELWWESLHRGTLLPIIPFNDILVSILTETSANLRCGAGWRDFAITTQGDVLPCPIFGMETFRLCTVFDADSNLCCKSPVGGPCRDCSYFSLCGGRCLYANRFNEWGDDGFRLVCRAAQHLIDKVVSRADSLRELLLRHPGLWDQLSTPVHHGCEVIP